MKADLNKVVTHRFIGPIFTSLILGLFFSLGYYFPYTIQAPQPTTIQHKVCCNNKDLNTYKRKLTLCEHEVDVLESTVESNELPGIIRSDTDEYVIKPYLDRNTQSFLYKRESDELIQVSKHDINLFLNQHTYDYLYIPETKMLYLAEIYISYRPRIIIQQVDLSDENTYVPDNKFIYTTESPEFLKPIFSGYSKTLNTPVFYSSFGDAGSTYTTWWYIENGEMKTIFDGDLGADSDTSEYTYFSTNNKNIYYTNKVECPNGKFYEHCATKIYVKNIDTLEERLSLSLDKPYQYPYNIGSSKFPNLLMYDRENKKIVSINVETLERTESPAPDYPAE